MTEAALAITWVSGDGVVHGAPADAASSIHLQPGVQIRHAASNGKCLVCVLCTCSEYTQVMAYSLQTGAELWASPVFGDWIVGIAGEAVWVGDPFTDVLRACDLGTGTVLAMLPWGSLTRAAVVTTGTWINHLLYMNRGSVTLYAPLASHAIWAVTAKEGDHVNLHAARDVWYTTRSQVRWYTTQSQTDYSTPNLLMSFHSLADGSRMPSVLDRPASRPPQAWDAWPAEILVAWSPNRVLVYVKSDAEAFLSHIDTADGANHTSQCPFAWRREVITQSPVVAVVARREHYLTVIDPKTAAVLDTMQTPDIVTAWKWSAADSARRECDELADAIAAVDELPGNFAAETAVGLVRAVLDDFVAEDARLTVLRLQ